MKGKAIPILIIGIVVAAIIIALIVFVTDDSQTTNTATINTNTTANTNAAGNYGGGGPLISFADCVAYDGTVFESYPRKCTIDNQTFTEDIGNEIEKADLIKIASPRPNDTIASPVTITGQARGTWFFEGEFPVFIYDILNQLIGQGSATAQGEWMTEEFVAFEATLEFTKPTNGPGTLYLNKHNASDNADLDDALIIPVDFPL